LKLDGEFAPLRKALRPHLKNMTTNEISMFVGYILSVEKEVVEDDGTITGIADLSIEDLCILLPIGRTTVIETRKGLLAKGYIVKLGQTKVAIPKYKKVKSTNSELKSTDSELLKNEESAKSSEFELESSENELFEGLKSASGAEKSSDSELKSTEFELKSSESEPLYIEREEEKKDTNVSFVEGSPEHRLSTLLFDLIVQNNSKSRLASFSPSQKEKHIQKWAKHIDLMLRVDKRNSADVEEVIYFAQRDGFWQDNILSTRKLREQFDQLYPKMLKAKQPRNLRQNNRAQNNKEVLARAMEEAQLEEVGSR